MLLPAGQKFIDEFFAAIAHYEAAFQHVGFSYLAVKFGTRFEILPGRNFLRTAPPPTAPSHPIIKSPAEAERALLPVSMTSTPPGGQTSKARRCTLSGRRNASAPSHSLDPSFRT